MMDYTLRPDLAVGSVSPCIGTECIRVCRQSHDVSIKRCICCVALWDFGVDAVDFGASHPSWKLELGAI